MLIIKAYVNHRKIEEIWVHNKGKYFSNKYGEDYYLYGIEKPEGIRRRFVHKRNKGWKPLAAQVLKHLVEVEETNVF